MTSPTPRGPASSPPDPAFVDRLERRLLAELTAPPRRGERSPDDARHTDHPTDRPTAEEAPVTIELDRDPTTRRSSRATWLAAAAALVVVGIGATAFVLSDDDPATATDPSAPDVVSPGTGTPVTFGVLWPDLGLSAGSNLCVDVQPIYLSSVRGDCLATWTGEAVLTGDVAGTALWAMLAGSGSGEDDDRTMTDVRGFAATYVVHATIDGCGTGEFMMTDSLGFVGWGAGAFVGTWRIVPGSGRGDLTDIAGSGEVLPQPDVDEVASLPREHTGSITC